MIYSALFTEFLYFSRTHANARNHISRNCKEKDLEIYAVQLH